jgi:protein-S-isoprenylcysteine O-methyltransferase Ste14
MFNNLTELTLRIIALSIFLLWTSYWLITERRADREKPKIRELTFFHKDNIRKLVLRFAEAVLILQLLGLPLFQISNSSVVIQMIGLVFVILGASISISARKELGTNWAHAFEYQIKKKQELVTTGVYSFIRHPIYTGIILGFVGGELVAKSYLALFGLFLIVGAYHQAKLEEKLLIKHSRDSYKKYMKQTKMFIPHLW